MSNFLRLFLYRNGNIVFKGGLSRGYCLNSLYFSAIVKKKHESFCAAGKYCIQVFDLYSDWCKNRITLPRRHATTFCPCNIPSCKQLSYKFIRKHIAVAAQSSILDGATFLQIFQEYPIPSGESQKAIGDPLANSQIYCQHLDYL